MQVFYVLDLLNYNYFCIFMQKAKVPTYLRRYNGAFNVLLGPTPIPHGVLEGFFNQWRSQKQRFLEMMYIRTIKYLRFSCIS